MPPYPVIHDDQAYVKPEAVAGAQQRRVMTVPEGGRLAS
jgi:hypothetical protein